VREFPLLLSLLRAVLFTDNYRPNAAVANIVQGCLTPFASGNGRHDRRTETGHVEEPNATLLGLNVEVAY